MTVHYVIDGEVIPADEAVINVRDRGFLYGDAAFETMRVYGGSVFAFDEHMDRLEQTCEILALDHGLDRSQLAEWIDLALGANDLTEAAIRLSITRGVQPGVLSPQPSVDPTTVIIVRPIDRGGIEGPPARAKPARVSTVDIEKIPDTALPARAKTHNYLNGILARLELEEDVDEAILCDGDGQIAEGTTSNVFIVEDGTLITPSLEGPVLPGITRQVVLDLAEELDIETAEATFDRATVSTADEAFLTNTTAEVWPIDAINGEPIEVGPLTQRLREAYRELIETKFYTS